MFLLCQSIRNSQRILSAPPICPTTTMLLERDGRRGGDQRRRWRLQQRRESWSTVLDSEPPRLQSLRPLPSRQAIQTDSLNSESLKLDETLVYSCPRTYHQINEWPASLSRSRRLQLLQPPTSNVSTLYLLYLRDLPRLVGQKTRVSSTITPTICLTRRKNSRPFSTRGAEG